MRCGLIAVFAVLAGAALAEPRGGLTAQQRRGEALLTKFCAECHAVGRNDASRQPEAVPFRNLGQRYRIEALEEALAEGLISGHPEMPETPFEAADVGDIIAYLNAIQSR